MDHLGIVSLIPPLLAILLAVLFRNVVVALFAGIFVGLLIVIGPNPVTTTMSLVTDHLAPVITDSYNAGVMILLFFIGGFVALVERSGGGAALASKAARLINSRGKGQISAWLGGLIVFFSDLGTPLIVGPIFEKIFDKLKLSREKLAWIIDSTSSPVAVLIPFIGWGIYIMGLIREEFDREGLQTSEFTVFVQAIPFQFYAILAVTAVPVVALTRTDFGAMRRAEQRVRDTGELHWPNSKPLRQSESSTVEGMATESRPIVIWLPLLVLFITLFSILTTLGFPADPVPGEAFRAALSTAYLFAALVLIALMLIFRINPIGAILGTYVKGMEKMISVVLILVLAWTLGGLLEEMGTANFLVEMMSGVVPAALVPVLVFVCAAAMSFATGSSWGTFAIMIPLAIPVAFGLDAAVIVCIGAVLSGGIFGDHCSPISDSTILASTGAGTDLVDHVKTQLPYAVINGAIVAVSFVVAGFLDSPYIVVFSISAMIIVYLAISRVSSARKSRAVNAESPTAAEVD
ncbi:Na+/H+ antiporter NhaC [Brevibacterium sandarakinum]|uniref:Na+/H+ antiporter NhaC n=1 Tax=Brevibacterium sandarakinum TaxID=629680 RepID=A0A1H1QKU4_BRESA|nr:Na+/H+ antiporter NhaC family protein [Brevibacterium sandarakinum]SDS24102.1 Na+/H+ antiporter NhaC [Brevibacterium sandarakinum]